MPPTRSFFLLASSGLIACSGGAAKPVVPSPVGSASVTPSASASASESAEAIAPPPPPLVVPAWLGDETAGKIDRYVRRVVDGPVRASKGGAILNRPDGRAMLVALPVIDEDAKGSPPAPRVLCDDAGVRAALVIDRAELATVALEGAVMVTNEKALATIKPDSPGVFFVAGTPLTPPEPLPDGGVVSVSFKGFLVEARGFMDRTKLGYAYTKPAATEPEGYDLEVKGGATLLDAPTKGAVVAKLEAYPSTLQRHVVKKLRQKYGFDLVRFDGDDFKIVGWVEAQAVKSVPPQSGGYGYGTMSGESRPKNALRVKRGTLFTPRGSRDVVGMAKADGAFECVADCETGAPELLVDTCLGGVKLVANAPAK